MAYTTHVYDLPEGKGQIFVTIWESGNITTAHRDNSWDRWSPPLKATRVEKVE